VWLGGCCKGRKEQTWSVNLDRTSLLHSARRSILHSLIRLFDDLTCTFSNTLMILGTVDKRYDYCLIPRPSHECLHVAALTMETASQCTVSGQQAITHLPLHLPPHLPLHLPPHLPLHFLTLPLKEAASPDTSGPRRQHDHICSSYEPFDQSRPGSLDVPRVSRMTGSTRWDHSHLVAFLRAGDQTC
jgi:hypothetical protein